MDCRIVTGLQSALTKSLLFRPKQNLCSISYLLVVQQSAPIHIKSKSVPTELCRTNAEILTGTGAFLSWNFSFGNLSGRVFIM